MKRQVWLWPSSVLMAVLITVASMGGFSGPRDLCREVTVAGDGIIFAKFAWIKDVQFVDAPQGQKDTLIMTTVLGTVERVHEKNLSYMTGLRMRRLPRELR